MIDNAQYKSSWKILSFGDPKREEEGELAKGKSNGGIGCKFLIIHMITTFLNGATWVLIWITSSDALCLAILLLSLNFLNLKRWNYRENRG